MLPSTVGDADEMSEGFVDGLSLKSRGSIDGKEEGSTTVGLADGCFVRTLEGDEVGLVLGPTDGSTDSSFDGNIDGRNVGISLGP